MLDHYVAGSTDENGALHAADGDCPSRNDGFFQNIVNNYLLTPSCSNGKVKTTFF